jgi:hypothetical protein
MVDLFVDLGVLGKFGFGNLSDLGREEVWTCECVARRGTTEETITTRSLMSRSDTDRQA